MKTAGSIQGKQKKTKLFFAQLVSQLIAEQEQIISCGLGCGSFMPVLRSSATRIFPVMIVTQKHHINSRRKISNLILK